MTDLQEKVRDDITTKGPHRYAKSDEPSHEIACGPRSSEQRSVKSGIEEPPHDALKKSKR